MGAPCKYGGGKSQRKLVVSLCDHTGNWSRPYAEDPNYEVRKIDLLDGRDVRPLPYIYRPVHGMLAAPPCTHFSSAGAMHSGWTQSRE